MYPSGPGPSAGIEPQKTPPNSSGSGGAALAGSTKAKKLAIAMNRRRTTMDSGIRKLLFAPRVIARMLVCR
jgi:hypothetical protein